MVGRVIIKIYIYLERKKLEEMKREPAECEVE